MSPSVRFFFNDAYTPETYTFPYTTLFRSRPGRLCPGLERGEQRRPDRFHGAIGRSEEHTSELQSHVNLVCRLLLEKKKKEATASRERRCPAGHPARPCSEQRCRGTAEPCV